MAAPIRTVIGSEMSTFDFGHAIAFPLPIDPDSRDGGAIDWAGGRGPTLTPGEIYAAARERGAEVIQLNHARSGGRLGQFDMLLLDTATLATHADPVLQAALVDAVSGVMVAALFVIAAGLVMILLIPALPLRSFQMMMPSALILAK